MADETKMKKPTETEVKKPAKRKKPATAAQRKADASAKGKPWTFPKNNLEDAIGIAKAVEEKNAGNPMPAQDIALAVGYRLASDWRFQDLLRSANLYGLVSGTGKSALISLTQLGQDIVAPSSPGQRSEALVAAFRNVKDFASVEAFYKGKRIPEDEFFLNTLTREFQIPRDRVDAFAKTFVENQKFLRSFSSSATSVETLPNTGEQTSATTPADKIPSPTLTREPRVREFLDTCFVMMPFGAWFDRYYQEIYVPAIKEAGFEPCEPTNCFQRVAWSSKFGNRLKKPSCYWRTSPARTPPSFMN
jgi:hypothetical protein